MDTQLLNKILDAARHAATGAEAMRIEDLQRDLALLPEGPDFIDEMQKIEDFDKLKAHIEVQPFDTLENANDPCETLVTSLEPEGFHMWLGELERLAQ